ncbi:uncharacterized protein LOC132719211 isoform X2 [Ruditapes philippinarum]|uniref:uncharacterized protein LOC132719211 isoform X2 n=1 Tax=Ruditapes philippinarum TaxID=129788 RepID=UPI00295B96EC|nr:uncharacterized protein LOC132719211 isoform X2 [Ruditapes philippinarum]
MEETSLDYNLLKTYREENENNASRALKHKNRISMRKSTFYVLLLSVFIFLIGSETLVYLLSKKNNTCNCIVTDSFIKRNSSHHVSKPCTTFSIMQTTKPNQVTLPNQTTTSQQFTSSKSTTTKSVKAVASLATTLSTRITTSGCPTNWIPYGQSCYFFSNQFSTWLDAMNRCQNMNGYLVEITSADEDQFLKEQAVSLNIHNNIDCFKTSSNRYNGFKSTTYDGHTCQRWDSQTPHKHSRNQADRFPDASVADAANYCRDPDDEGLPWCYTTDPDVRWQLCGIYKCPGDCFKISSNRYNGFESTTYDGHTCQRWDSQTPHKHSRNQADRFPDASVADAANYCRDPDGEGLPWCYTTDPDVRWQLCGIYKCTGGNYWAGMTALGENWKWLHTQTKLDEGYTNWGQNQHRLGNCGVLAAELNYQWKKNKCSYPAKFICEKVKY